MGIVKGAFAGAMLFVGQCISGICLSRKSVNVHIVGGVTHQLVSLGEKC